MYLDSNDKKDKQIKLRISNNEYNKINKFMNEFNIKTISDFLRLTINEKINKENTLISM